MERNNTSFCVPNLSVLPGPQKALFVELKDTPSHFVLCGGTAIALRLGHRISVDFDFFSKENFDPDALYDKVPYLKEAEILQKENNTLTCLVDRNGPVNVSFFGGLTFQYIKSPDILKGPGIKIATLLDLAAMKATVVQKRATAKDYSDIDALLLEGIDLATVLAAGSLMYGRRFNSQITLKALTYFKEGDLETLSPEIKDRLVQAVKKLDERTILKRIDELQQQRSICP